MLLDWLLLIGMANSVLNPLGTFSKITKTYRSLDLTATKMTLYRKLAKFMEELTKNSSLS